MFLDPPLPPAFADAAYNLLIASTCRCWRRLARRHVSTLLVKTNRAVSLEDLMAALDCFPNLTHLHLSGSSAQDIDETFLARPNLTGFHLERPIVESPESDQAGETLLRHVLPPVHAAGAPLAGLPALRVPVTFFTLPPHASPIPRSCRSARGNNSTSQELQRSHIALD
ncbi:unnamed protein product [Closterium sp. NIES-54]